jgi:flagellin
MVIRNNISAMNTNRIHNNTNVANARSVEKLSSGRKINRGADDAANLAISEKMYRQMFALNQAANNAMDGVSSLQTADGALDQVNNMLNRMSELAVRAGNDTLSASDRSNLESEMNSLRGEIDRISQTATFNDQNLLDGSLADGRSIQVGSEVSGENQINITIANMDWASISGSGNDSISLQNSDQISSAMENIRAAQRNVSTMRSDIGATQNRLGSTISNMRNVSENTTASASRIRDTDMAEEMVKSSSQRILARAQEAMMAKTNQNNLLAIRLMT